MRQYWIIIERLENWEADRATGFKMFGLKQRYKRAAARIGEGDILFCYVSKISAFADMRRVELAGWKPLRRSTTYDEAFDCFISTSPVLVLEWDFWLPVSEILADLNLTRGKKEWRSLFRTSLRQLTTHDGELLASRMQARGRGLT